MTIIALRDSWFLTLIFNYLFISYYSDSSLYIIVIITYSDIKLPYLRVLT